MRKHLYFLGFLLLLVAPVGADDPTPEPAATTSPAPTVPPVISHDASILMTTKDGGMGSDGTAKDVDSYQVRVGELYAPGGEAFILPIYLPVVGEGERFKNVHLRLQMLAIFNEAGGNTVGNADLYGLGVRDSFNLLASDYFQGPGPDPKATLLQANFLTPDSKPRTDQETGPFIETSAAGDTALTKYFNNAYARGAQPRQYIFLRISYDRDPIPAGNDAYQLLTSGASGDQERPIITYTLEPGPKN